jgi:hypothetical protein
VKKVSRREKTGFEAFFCGTEKRSRLYDLLLESDEKVK